MAQPFPAFRSHAKRIMVLGAVSRLLACAASAGEVDQAAELAKQLSNPIASLISVPFQANQDFGLGPDGDGTRFTLNIQPVIPVSISRDWNLIVRTILPVISQDDVIGSTSQSGLGDTTQSFFFSPKEPGAGGIVWGLGPVWLVPTATDDLLGGEKWGAGPTFVALRQTGGWTIGALVNQIWSVAGDGDRTDISAMFLQPFLSYTTRTHTTLALNTESTYNWETSEWTVPLNLSIAQILKLGRQPVQIQVGGRYYAEGPDGAPEWGVRLTFTLLFPTAKHAPAPPAGQTYAK